jgi:hypothetical protein
MCLSVVVCMSVCVYANLLVCFYPPPPFLLAHLLQQEQLHDLARKQRLLDKSSMQSFLQSVPIVGLYCAHVIQGPVH